MDYNPEFGPTETDLYAARRAQEESAHLYRLSRLARPEDRHIYQERNRMKANEARFWMFAEALIFDPL